MSKLIQVDFVNKRVTGSIQTSPLAQAIKDCNTALNSAMSSINEVLNHRLNIEAYLDDYEFRNYKMYSPGMFGKVNTKASINLNLSGMTIEECYYWLDEAIYTFERDGYSIINIYL